MNFSQTQMTISVLNFVLVIITPLVAAMLVRWRFGVGWRFFAYGALVFFLSQVVIRIPIVTALQLALAGTLQSNRSLAFAFGAGLAFTAGLFEGVGRYLGYRFLMRKDAKTWAQGVMYGIGHGGFEAILLVGILGGINTLVLMNMTADQIAALPAAAQTQLDTLKNLPSWLGLAGAWERFFTIIFHTAMSVMVLQVFRKQQIRWLWAAVVIHGLVDFVGAVLPPFLISDYVTRIVVSELLMAFIGGAGLLYIVRMRDTVIGNTVV